MRMLRHRLIAPLVVGLCLAASTVLAQSAGPFSAQVQAALRALGIVTGVSFTNPKLIGGTTTTSTITIQPTSANGVAGADIIFKVGNNGATEVARFPTASTTIVPAFAVKAPSSSGSNTLLFTLRDSSNNVRMSVQEDGAMSGPSTISVTNSLTTPLLQSTVAKVLFQGTGSGATQIATVQTTPPTCTTNCGTPGNVCVGTDTFMKCTMGTTPASGVLITFNGTWAAAPACTVQMALAGMVVGKQVLTAATTTTTITLVTNGTAPATGDVYAIHCGGIQ